MAGAIVFHSAVSPCDREGIVQTVFFQSRIVRVFVHLFITDLLHGKILGRINTESAAVKGIVGLSLRVAQLRLKIR